MIEGVIGYNGQCDLVIITRYAVFSIDSHPDLKELLQNRYDAYLIEALHLVIHELDSTYAEFKEMSTESDFDKYVKDQRFRNNIMKDSKGSSDSSYVIEPVKIDQEYPESSKKANIMILPLSIEDESLTTSTASVMREFSKDLDIIVRKSNDLPMYNTQNRKFDIQGARERYIFYKEMDYHTKDMKKFRRQLEEREGDNNQVMDDLVNCGDDFHEGSFKQQLKQLSNKAKDKFLIRLHGE